MQQTSAGSPSKTVLTSSGDEISVAIFSAVTPRPSPPSTLPSVTLPPLIYHITAPNGLSSPTTPFKLLTVDLQLPEVLVTQIANIGGFYLHIPYPRRSPRAQRGTETVLHSELPVGKRVYIRLHIHPKRYSVREFKVLSEEDGVLCVYKPSGLPVCAGVDNIEECLTNLVGGFVTTRIDVGTSGIVFLTRERGMVTTMNKRLQEGQKYYMVFAELRNGDDDESTIWRDWYRAKPELGRGNRPCILRRIEEEEVEGWVEARLEIVSRRCSKFGNNKGRVFVVRLYTGRTHQIRIQMAARGYYVVGDTKYESVVGGVYKDCVVGGDASKLGLHCWLVHCRKWWKAEVGRRRDLVDLVEGDAGFWEWLNEVEGQLRNGLNR